MKCPECRSASRRVIDSRHTGVGIRRRSECLRCKARWSTMEVDAKAWEQQAEKEAKMSLRCEFMEAAQSELNKAYFRVIEQLKKRSVLDVKQHEADFCPPIEAVSFTDSRFKREA